MKCCTKCSQLKPLSDFHKAKSFSDGHYSQCKLCRKTINRTEKNVIYTMYRSQKLNSKHRNHPMLTYTRDEFYTWCISQPNFKDLYNNYVQSGYSKKLVPSCDRIDDYLPYTLDNIQLTTFEQNDLKGHISRVNGINQKANSSVYQYSKDGQLLNEFHSLHEASRQTGVGHANIYKVCEFYNGTGKDKRRYAGNFIWKYKQKVIKHC